MKANFHTQRGSLRALLVVIGLLSAALAVPAGAQSTKAGEARPPAGMIDLEGAKSVLGTANDLASGVVDLTRGDNEVIVAYRFYDADAENYETDFANELAPRIQSLYKKFPGLNGVRFQVTANDPLNEGVWKPFAEFVLDRKTVQEIHWTGFLARYLLDLVLRSKK